jgi:hypothetical protein
LNRGLGASFSSSAASFTTVVSSRISKSKLSSVALLDFLLHPPTPVAKQDVGQEQVAAGGASKAEIPSNNDGYRAEKEVQPEVRAADDSLASQVVLSPQRPPLPTEAICKSQGRKGCKWKGRAEDGGKGSECKKGVLAWILGALLGGRW